MDWNYLTTHDFGNKLLATGIIGCVLIIVLAYKYSINLSGLVLSINYAGISSFFFSIALFVLICVWTYVGICIIKYFETLGKTPLP
jgi:hypothetical protein